MSDPEKETLATGGTPETSTESSQETQTGNWTENFSDVALKDKMSRYKSGEEVAKAYVSLESKLGNSVEVPGENATQEELDKFYTRVGRPDTSDGYELSTVQSEGIPRSAESDKIIADRMFQAGYTKKQARELWQFMMDSSSRELQRIKDERTEAMNKASTQLRQDWGAEYDPNIVLMNRSVARFDDKNGTFKQFLNEGSGNDPRQVRFLATVGKSMSEETLEGKHPGNLDTIEKREPGVLTYDKSPQLTGDNRVRTAG